MRPAKAVQKKRTKMIRPTKASLFPLKSSQNSCKRDRLGARGTSIGVSWGI
jgi:hypothetical protein